MSADGVRNLTALRSAVAALQWAISCIDDGMYWSDTDEGVLFWQERYDSLIALRNKLEDKIDEKEEEDEEEEDEDEEDEEEDEDDWTREWREFEQKGDGNG